MKPYFNSFSLASWLSLLSLSSALIPITTQSNRFVRPAIDAQDPGQEFVVVGVDYQIGGSSAFNPSGNSDVLTDEDVCLRDAFVLQQLGVNAIRVYAVNPWLNHDACMSIFNAIGIYVLLDVNNPYEALSRTDPGSTYNKGYLNNVFGIIDAFKDYPNLMGFISGNEVVNDAASGKVVPQYIRAVQRDMKQYIQKHANRTDIPVGYAATDDSMRAVMWQYLQCGDGISKSDFYALNSYDWCSAEGANYQTSGYNVIQSTYANSSIPVFFSEYGCNAGGERTFTEVYEGIYAGLLKSLSGGLVYSYSNGANNYGLVNVSSDGDVYLLQDFGTLQKAYNKITLPTTPQSDIPSHSAPVCSSDLITSLDPGFQSNFTLPACPAPEMLKNGGGNNNIGKIIALNSTQTTYKIFNVYGEQIENTAITVDQNNEINSPNGTDTNSEKAATTSSSVSASKSKSKAGAGTLETSGLLVAMFAMLASFV